MKHCAAIRRKLRGKSEGLRFPVSGFRSWKIRNPRSAIRNRPAPQLPQALEHRPNHEAPHLRLAAKADLALRGVHVHVDRRGVAFEENERERVAALRERLVV